MDTYCRHPGQHINASSTQRRSGSKTFTIDIHNHIAIRSATDYIRGAAPDAMQTMGSGNPLSAEVQRRSVAAVQLPLTDAATRIGMMDKAGIDIQALSPSPAHYYYAAPAEHAAHAHRLVNDGIAEIVACHPDRFVGMGVVPMQEPKLAIAEIKRMAKRLGFRGVEIGANINGDDLSHPKFRPFFAAAEALGILVFLHPLSAADDRMANYFLDNVVGNPLDATLAISHLVFGGVLQRYPKLKICVAHGGGYLPAYTGRMEHAYHAREDCRTDIVKPPSYYLRKLYFDSLVFEQDQLEFLVKRYGAKRILMGTDFPFDMSEQDAVGFIGSSALSDEEKSAIYYKNAARLLGLKLPRGRK
jgi:aminocarboxymuconate-semialdehyde decarboxylase